MTRRYFYEDQEATTKWEHGTRNWGGEREKHKQIAPDEGFRIYSYDYYDFTFYNLQLWAAAKHRRIRRSRQTDKHTLRKPLPRHTTPLLPPLAEAHT